MPAIFAASSTVVPAGTVTETPSIFSVTSLMVFSSSFAYFLEIAPNLHFSMQAPHLMHLLGVDDMGLSHLAGDGAHGAVAGAEGAALALGGIDLKVQQLVAHAGGTALLLNMRLILVAEMLQSGQNGVGRGLTQGAQGVTLEILAARSSRLLDIVRLRRCLRRCGSGSPAYAGCRYGRGCTCRSSRPR